MSRPSMAVAAAVALGLVAPGAWALETAKPAPVVQDASQDRRCTPGAALRVQLQITRVQDGRKEASLPYTFVVSARPFASCPYTHVRMRMGIDTPVPELTFDESDPKKPKVTSVQYKTVGTNIDCSAEDLGDGRFKLLLTVENSSALPGRERTQPDAVSAFPLFRRFEASLDPILRDGQKAETVTSTDPVTGEVVKIDVSVNVVK